MLQRVLFACLIGAAAPAGAASVSSASATGSFSVAVPGDVSLVYRASNHANTFTPEYTTAGLGLATAETGTLSIQDVVPGPGGPGLPYPPFLFPAAGVPGTQYSVTNIVASGHTEDSGFFDARATAAVMLRLNNVTGLIPPFTGANVTVPVQGSYSYDLSALIDTTCVACYRAARADVTWTVRENGVVIDSAFAEVVDAFVDPTVSFDYAVYVAPNPGGLASMFLEVELALHVQGEAYANPTPAAVPLPVGALLLVSALVALRRRGPV